MKYIILIISLLVSFSLQAVPTCSKNGTRVLYTNGIYTSFDDANKAMMGLQKAIVDDGNKFNRINIDLKSVKYELAYNYDENFTKDILEAIAQRLPQSYLDALSASNTYAAYSYFIQGKLLTSISASIIDSINLKKLEIISNFSRDYVNLPLYNQTINDIQIKYNAAFARGERVFAISHSQGGLFMNDVYSSLPESDNKKKYFSAFQIASVLGTEMNSHFGYATNDKDFVVNIVRDILGALPANLDTPLFISTSGLSDLFINHGILTTYLYDSSLKDQVIAKLIQTADLLESNCPKAVINYEKNDLQVNFDSTDPENPSLDGLTFFWDFGDGSSQETTTKNISHTYAAGGNFTVTLTVSDLFGNSDTTSTDIQFSAPLKAFINYTINNLMVYFDSTDPSNPDVEGLIYTWDFGDGKTQTTANKQIGHRYLTGGNFIITLTVQDSNGASSSTQTIVQLIAPKPTASIYVYRYPKQVSVYGWLNYIPLGVTVMYTIDFGDGHVVSTITPPSSGIYHQYSSPGTFTISLKGTDSLTGMLIAETSTIIHDYAPSIAILSQPDHQPSPGETFSYTIKCDLVGNTNTILTGLTAQSLMTPYNSNYTCTQNSKIDATSNTTTFTCTEKQVGCSSSYSLPSWFLCSAYDTASNVMYVSDSARSLYTERWCLTP